MMLSCRHMSPNPRPLGRTHPTNQQINQPTNHPIVPPSQKVGSCTQRWPHVADVMVTRGQGASSLFYSSRPGITVKLLLSIGAAGRPVSPIWSQNLLEDQVCLAPRGGGSTWQVRVIPAMPHQFKTHTFLIGMLFLGMRL